MKKPSFVAFLALLLAAPLLCAQPANADRTTAWQHDLDLFASILHDPASRPANVDGQTTQPPRDLNKLYPPTKFAAALADLRLHVAERSDDELALGLMQLMASAHVAHNVVYGAGEHFASGLPILWSFTQDGLVITAATPQHADLLGARVLSIGAEPVSSLLDRLRPYISFETDAWFLHRAESALAWPAILAHFHLQQPDGTVTLTLQDASGQQRIVHLPVAYAFDEIEDRSTLLHQPEPLRRQQPDRNYWQQFLPQSGTLYVNYRRCTPDKKQSMQDFAAEVEAAFNAHPVQAVVVDLRANNGGNSELYAPLLRVFAAHRSVPMRVLIGPGTFSSGSMNAWELHQRLHAQLVGSTAGGYPGGYGEVEGFELPYSHLSISYSIKHFPHGSRLEPDLRVLPTVASVRAGDDVELAAALKER